MSSTKSAKCLYFEGSYFKVLKRAKWRSLSSVSGKRFNILARIVFHSDLFVTRGAISSSYQNLKYPIGNDLTNNRARCSSDSGCYSFIFPEKLVTV